jgi:hypothetical protein
VETGSRQENASNLEPRFDSIETETAQGGAADSAETSERRTTTPRSPERLIGSDGSALTMLLRSVSVSAAVIIDHPDELGTHLKARASAFQSSIKNIICCSSRNSKLDWSIFNIKTCKGHSK